MHRHRQTNIATPLTLRSGPSQASCQLVVSREGDDMDCRHRDHCLFHQHQQKGPSAKPADSPCMVAIDGTRAQAASSTISSRSSSS